MSDADEKTERIAGLIHDAKSKLQSVIGYTEALQNGQAQTEEKRNSYLAAVALAAANLEALLSELSVLNRTGRLTVAKKSVSVSSLLKNYIAAYQSKWERNRVTWRTEMEENLELPLDADVFLRILDNLTGNTLKYRTAPQSVVSFTGKTDGTEAVLTYRDDGPGVPEEALAQLFEVGFRAAPDTVSGSGLGLSVVRDLVKLHGGTVVAENQKGLALIIRIPLEGGTGA